MLTVFIRSAIALALGHDAKRGSAMGVERAGDLAITIVRPPRAALCILLLLFAASCTSQKPERSVSRENSHLRWLIRLYIQAGQQGHQPTSEQDLKKYIASMPVDSRDRVLASADVSSANELFASERDGLPYVVFYGATPKGVAHDIIAYEQQGMDGRRFVGYSTGVVEEADEKRFYALVPDSARSSR